MNASPDRIEEILGKTIAMIRGDANYQKYMAAKRRAEFTREDNSRKMKQYICKEQDADFGKFGRFGYVVRTLPRAEMEKVLRRK